MPSSIVKKALRRKLAPITQNPPVIPTTTHIVQTMPSSSNYLDDEIMHSLDNLQMGTTEDVQNVVMMQPGEYIQTGQHIETGQNIQGVDIAEHVQNVLPSTSFDNSNLPPLSLDMPTLAQNSPEDSVQLTLNQLNAQSDNFELLMPDNDLVRAAFEASVMLPSLLENDLDFFS